jgi:DNA primase
MTVEQAALIARYTKRAYLLFDSDKAGTSATFRAADLLLAAGVHPSVVTLPPGEDPDTLVHGGGPEALGRHLDEALDVLDRKLQILQERDFFSSIERTRSAVDRLLPTLRAVRDPALRDIYVAKVADRTGVRRETLEEELAKAKPPAGPAVQEVRRYRPRREETLRVPPMGAEKLIVLLMLKDREWIERVAEQMGPEDFQDRDYRAIFEALLLHPDLTQPPPDLDPHPAQVLEELLGDQTELPQTHRVFEESLGKIRQFNYQRRLAEIDRLIETTTDEDRLAELLGEKNRLAAEARESGVDWGPAARRTLNRKSNDEMRGI